MRRVTFKVSFPLPEGATIKDAQEYVLDAVYTWRGSLRPPGGLDDNDLGDSMFGLDGDQVKVTRLNKLRKKAKSL